MTNFSVRTPNSCWIFSPLAIHTEYSKKTNFTLKLDCYSSWEKKRIYAGTGKSECRRWYIRLCKGYRLSCELILLIRNRRVFPKKGTSWADKEIQGPRRAGDALVASLYSSWVSIKWWLSLFFKVVLTVIFWTSERKWLWLITY